VKKLRAIRVYASITKVNKGWALPAGKGEVK
jgi:hypothetical protein